MIVNEDELVSWFCGGSTVYGWIRLEDNIMVCSQVGRYSFRSSLIILLGHDTVLPRKAITLHAALCLLKHICCFLRMINDTRGCYCLLGSPYNNSFVSDLCIDTPMNLMKFVLLWDELERSRQGLHGMESPEAVM